MNNVDFSDFSENVSKLMQTIYPDIVRKMLFGDQLSEFMTVVPNVEGAYTIPSAIISSLLQGYQTGLTAKGKATVTPNILVTERQKVDFPYDPIDYYDLYISAINKQGLTASQHPFELWMVNYIVEKWIEDFELNAAIGTKKTITEGVPSQAKHSLTGYYTIIKQKIKKGTVIPVKTGTWTASTILEYTEDFIDLIDEVYQYKSMNLLMSIKDSRAYSKDYRTEFGVNAGIPTSQEVIKNVYDSGTTVRGTIAQKGLNFMLATPPENFFKTVSRRNPRPLESQKIGRQHWFLHDAGQAMGFALDAMIFFAGQPIEAATALAAADIATTTASAKWEEVTEATGYRLDVSTDADFSTFVGVYENKAIDLSSLAKESITLLDGTVSEQYVLSDSITGLTTGTTYYYRVRAELQVEGSATIYTSDNSNVIEFETA